MYSKCDPMERPTDQHWYANDHHQKPSDRGKVDFWCENMSLHYPQIGFLETCRWWFLWLVCKVIDWIMDHNKELVKISPRWKHHDHKKVILVSKTEGKHLVFVGVDTREKGWEVGRWSCLGMCTCLYRQHGATLSSGWDKVRVTYRMSKERKTAWVIVGVIQERRKLIYDILKISARWKFKFRVFSHFRRWSHQFAGELI